MLFSSLEYLFFLPTVVLAFWLSPKPFRLPLLLFASYIFYMSWNPIMVLLVIAMTVFNFYWGKLIHTGGEKPRKKKLLIIGLAANLLCLAYFKYANFFIDSALSAYNLVGHQNAHFALNIILPLGISFFVFEFVHYLVDIYRGNKPLDSFTLFALFAAFFPTQIAGPIKRYQDFSKQIQEEKKFQLSYLDEGVPLIILGLAKKVLIANNLATVVDMMANTISSYSAPELWVFAYAFAFQVYFDFSGYTDIARGSAMLFGYRIPLNFNLPFIASSMSDLWRRWHMSLTTWLRDYLLIPISGFRGSHTRFAIATLITMTICGLWHGASWNFVLWGFYFGVCLVINNYFKRWRDNTEFLKSFFESKYFNWLSIFLTFQTFCLGAVIFRIHDLKTDFALMKKMLTLTPFHGTNIGGQYILARPELPVFVPVVLCIVAALLLANIPVSKLQESGLLKRVPVPIRASYMVLLVFIMLIFVPRSSSPFIYFQF
jgi:alginate O-acetyltransferase complex protein AlgI